MVLLALLIGLVFAAAALAGPLERRIGNAAGWLLSAVPAAVFGTAVTLVGPVSRGETITFILPWIPSLGVSFSLLLDGLSLLFVLIISGVGALVVLYGSRYLEDHLHEARFYSFILLFMGAMLLLVLAGNLLLLFVAWELTSISSYLLIGFNHDSPRARAAALQALLVTGLGGLALLAGLVIMGLVGGSFELAELLQRGGVLMSHPLHLPMLLLLLAGAFTKSAQVPFHFWLPGAMEAPTPVSAYLHSATMVKAGIYLLARLSPALGASVEWHSIVGTVGALTMLTGAVMALAQHDLKKILAYTTVSALGTLTMLLGLHTVESAFAAAVFLLVHSLYKGGLFLIAGSIDHETGTRDIRLLGKLRSTMPLTTVGMVLVALSMAGLPPLLGFISKELFYVANLQAPALAPFITAAGFAANVLMVAVAATLLVPFFGPLRHPEHAGHEPPFRMRLGPQLLALTGLVAGLWPVLVTDTLVNPAVSAMRAEPVSEKLALWHGINPVLALSVVTVALGLAVFALRERIMAVVPAMARIAARGPASWYEGLLDGVRRFATSLTRLLQGGYLRVYISITLLFGVLLIGYALVTRSGHLLFTLPAPDLQIHELLLGAVMIGAAFAAVRAEGRLAAIAALGTVGLGVALLFVFYGAPDLALTQFAIETLTVLLFVLVLYRLPRFTRISSRRSRIRDAALATAGGVLMTTLTLVATSQSLRSAVAQYYGDMSLLLAKGRNVVNVILVDFRGLDTLGEITVLAVAALGVFALIRLRPGKEERR